MSEIMVPEPSRVTAEGSADEQLVDIAKLRRIADRLSEEAAWDRVSGRDSDGRLKQDHASDLYGAAAEIKRLRAVAKLSCDALCAAKRELWDRDRPMWNFSDFKNFAVVQQIDNALSKIRGSSSSLSDSIRDGATPKISQTEAVTR